MRAWKPHPNGGALVLESKHGQALVFKSGAWFVSVGMTAETEEEAKRFAESLLDSMSSIKKP